MRQLTGDANLLTLQIIGIAAVISAGINDEGNLTDDVYLLLLAADMLKELFEQTCV